MSNEINQDNSVKTSIFDSMPNWLIKVLIVMVLAIIILTIYNACSKKQTTEDIISAGSVKSAKEAVDDVFEEFEDRFEMICEGKNNDQRKESFRTLDDDMHRAVNAARDNKNLDYKEQKDVCDYAHELLKKNTKLEQLFYKSKVDC